MSFWKINISLLFRPFVIRGPWISLLGFQDAIKAKRNTRSSAIVPTKGQLISKELYGILNSSKKRTKKFDLTTMIPQIELFLFFF